MKPTLLILAAGVGSRYGGLKQVDPIGPHGEWIMDYALYDALKAGFGKVVCVIRRDIEQAFRERFAHVFDHRVPTAFAYQELDSEARAVREKPWGTGHAVLCAATAIAEPFAVINADDYYGPQAYRLMHEHLCRLDRQETRDYAMVGYRLRNTLSSHGSVCRGICAQEDGALQQVRECCAVQEVAGAISGEYDAGVPVAFTGSELVSLNLWGFGPDFFTALTDQFQAFRARHGSDPRREFYLPAAVDSLIRNQARGVRVLPTEEHWFGVTYPADRAEARTHLRARIDAGQYPEQLWT